MQIVKLSVTVRARLKHKYSPAKLKRIRKAIRDWKKADSKRGIQTVHVEVDNPKIMKRYGVPPVKLVDGKATAADVKEAVDALWEKLKPEYLVLFGGCDVIPMFVVANPFDPKGDNEELLSQQQEKVPTDNPYASSLSFRPHTRRSYLVPDRVIGRIPDMIDSKDPAWLIRY